MHRGGGGAICETGMDAARTSHFKNGTLRRRVVNWTSRGRAKRNQYWGGTAAVAQKKKEWSGLGRHIRTGMKRRTEAGGRSPLILEGEN